MSSASIIHYKLAATEMDLLEWKMQQIHHYVTHYEPTEVSAQWNMWFWERRFTVDAELEEGTGCFHSVLPEESGENS